MTPHDLAAQWRKHPTRCVICGQRSGFLPGVTAPAGKNMACQAHWSEFKASGGVRFADWAIAKIARGVGVGPPQPNLYKAANLWKAIMARQKPLLVPGVDPQGYIFTSAPTVPPPAPVGGNCTRCGLPNEYQPGPYTCWQCGQDPYQ